MTINTVPRTDEAMVRIFGVTRKEMLEAVASMGSGGAPARYIVRHTKVGGSPSALGRTLSVAFDEVEPWNWDATSSRKVWMIPDNQVRENILRGVER